MRCFQTLKNAKPMINLAMRASVARVDLVQVDFRKQAVAGLKIFSVIFLKIFLEVAADVERAPERSVDLQAKT